MLENTDRSTTGAWSVPRKALAIFMSVVLAFGLNPIAKLDRAYAGDLENVGSSALTTLAEGDTNVASAYKDNTLTNYTSLQDAINNADAGTTVTLLDNVDLGGGRITVASDKIVILDLAGKTVKSTNRILDNYGTLTVKDDSGNGTLDSGWVGIVPWRGSTTTFAGGTIESVESAIATMTDKEGDGATINITGGTLNCSDNAVLRTNGTNGCGGHTFNISGGTFNGKIKTAGYAACGIYAANNDTWNITGGTFNITNGAGIVQRAGAVNVSGNVVINTTGTATGKVGDSRVVVPCSALVFDSAAGYPGLTSSSELGVTGGQFTSEAPVAAFVKNDGDVKRVSISGGQFNKVPAAECLADGKGAFVGTEGAYAIEDAEASVTSGDGVTYYKTVAEAAGSAPENATIKLLGDVTLGAESHYAAELNAADVTFDGGNHTITLEIGAPSANWGYGLRLNADGITVKDLKINRSDKSKESLLIGIFQRAGATNAVLDNVTVDFPFGKANSAYRWAVYSSSAGPLTISRCDLKAKYALSLNDKADSGTGKQVTISDSTSAAGWANVAMGGNDYKVTVRDSTFSSTNYWDGDDNNAYAAFWFGGGVAAYESYPNGHDNEVTVTNTALTVGAKGLAHQALAGSAYFYTKSERESNASLANSLRNNHVYLGEGNTVALEDAGSIFDYGDTPIAVTGGTFTGANANPGDGAAMWSVTNYEGFDDATLDDYHNNGKRSYLAEGYGARATGETTWVVVKEYAVETAAGPAEGGSVTVEPTAAVEGETVSVTATPNKDYVLDSITVTDASDNPVTLAEDNTFTMPASNVTVTAVFSKMKEREIGGPTSFDVFIDDAPFSLEQTLEGEGVLSYESSDESVVTVDDGRATIVGKGTTTITVTAPATDTQLAATKTITITVSECVATITKDETTTRFASLVAAIAAAEAGDTVTLQKDVNASDQIAITKSLTLDLGGKTVSSTYTTPTSPTDDTWPAMRATGVEASPVEVTVKNGVFTTTNEDGVYANKFATVTLGEDLKVVSSGTTVMANYGTLVIDGADVSASTGKCKVASTWGSGTLKLLSGSVTSTGNDAVCAWDGSTFEMTGGTVAHTGDADHTAITVDPKFYNAAGKATISGGKVSGKIASGSGGDVDAAKKVSISGGLFSDESAKAFAADGKAIVANDDDETSEEYGWKVVDAYRVTVGEVGNGTVTVAVGDAEAGATAEAIEGATVTVNATPTENYYLDKLTYTAGDEEAQELGIEPAGGECTFAMPAKSVVVNAVFAEKKQQTITIETSFEKSIDDEKTFDLGQSLDGDGALSFESSDVSVVTVDENGAVTIVGVGTATITIKAAATDTQLAAEATVTVTVRDEKAEAAEAAQSAFKAAYDAGSYYTVTWDQLFSAMDTYDALVKVRPSSTVATTLTDYYIKLDKIRITDDFAKSDVGKAGKRVATEGLKNLTGLTAIYLCDTTNTAGAGVADIGDLKALDVFATKTTAEDGTVTVTPTFPSLTTLELSGNAGITDVSALGCYTKLTTLKLNDVTGLTTLKGLEGASALETIDVSNSGLTEFDAFYSNNAPSFPNLKKLTAKNLNATNEANEGQIKSIDALFSVAQRGIGENVTWDFTGSILNEDYKDAVRYITAAFSGKTGSSFIAPTVWVSEPICHGSLEPTGDDLMGVEPAAGYGSVFVGLTIAGTSHATEVGNYEVTATPMEGYAWHGGGTTSKPYKWWIASEQSSFAVEAAADSIEIASNETEQAILADKAYKVTTAAVGTVTYEKSSGDGAFVVDAKTGAITVAGGTAEKTYEVGVIVTDLGGEGKFSKSVPLTLSIKIVAPVASVTENGTTMNYVSVADAVAAASAGATVTLCQNAEAKDLKLSKAVKFDGDGKTLTVDNEVTEAGKYAVGIDVSADATLKNLVVAPSSGVTGGSALFSAIRFDSSVQTAVLDNVSVSIPYGTTQKTNRWAVRSDQPAGSSLTLKDCTLEAKYCIYLGASGTDESNAKVEVDGGTLTGCAGLDLRGTYNDVAVGGGCKIVGLNPFNSQNDAPNRAAISFQGVAASGSVAATGVNNKVVVNEAEVTVQATGSLDQAIAGTTRNSSYNNGFTEDSINARGNSVMLAKGCEVSLNASGTGKAVFEYGDTPLTITGGTFSADPREGAYSISGYAAKTRTETGAYSGTYMAGVSYSNTTNYVDKDSVVLVNDGKWVVRGTADALAAKVAFDAEYKANPAGKVSWDTLVKALESYDAVKDATDDNDTVKSLTAYYNAIDKLDLSNATPDVADSGIDSVALLAVEGADGNPAARFPNLTELDLSGNSKLTDISALSASTSLTSLNLGGTGVSELDALSGMTKLTSLDISGSGVDNLDILWDDGASNDAGAARYPSLTTLTAEKLDLVSIDAAAKVAGAEGFSNAVKWDFKDSKLTEDRSDSWATIKDAFTSNSGNLTALTVYVSQPQLIATGEAYTGEAQTFLEPAEDYGKFVGYTLADVAGEGISAATIEAGSVKATDAGDYAVTATLKGDYKWLIAATSEDSTNIDDESAGDADGANNADVTDGNGSDGTDDPDNSSDDNADGTDDSDDAVKTYKWTITKADGTLAIDGADEGDELDEVDLLLTAGTDTVATGTAKLKDSKGELEVVLPENSPVTATIGEDGVTVTVTANEKVVAPTSAAVTIKDPGNDNYNEKIVTINVTVPGQVDVPEAKADLVYNGDSQEGIETFEDIENPGYELSGDLTATNAGTYRATATLKSGYAWADGTTDSKEIEWTIAKKQIGAPTATAEFTYDGAEKKAIEADEDAAYTLTDATATDAGDYTATVTLKDTGNTEWADNTSEAKTFPWTIKRAQVDVPVAAGPFTYDGKTHTGVAAGEGYELTGDVTATDAGTYEATATLDKNHEWNLAESSDPASEPGGDSGDNSASDPNDGSGNTAGGDSGSDPSGDDSDNGSGDNSGDPSDDESGDNSDSEPSVDPRLVPKTITWTIDKAEIAVPTAAGPFTYDGTAKTGVATGVGYDLSGTATATAAGTYTATATPQANYEWETGGTDAKSITWIISKAKVKAPTAAGPFTYDGTAKTGVAVGAGYALSGTASETKAGTYTATATPDANHEWEAGGSDPVTLTWAISKAKVAAPTAAGPFTFDGTAKTGVAEGVGYELSGDATATAAGTYTATATLTDPANTEWASGGADAKTLTWTINPAPAEPDQPSTPDEPSEPSTPDQPATPDASNPTSGSDTTSDSGSDSTATTEATPTAGEVVTNADAGAGVTADVVVNADAASVTLTHVDPAAASVSIDTVMVDGVALPVTEIAKKALKGSKAKTIKVGDSIVKIGANAFAGTKKLKSLTIGKGVKTVGKQVLKGSGVKKVTVKSSALNKKNFKNLLKSSKVKTVKTSGVAKKAKKQYKKWAKSLKVKVK